MTIECAHCGRSDGTHVYPETRARDLNRQLRAEKAAHTQTRNQLQAEIRRWQWLARPQILDLMGIYPPLRRLLVVLIEAADLQDPSRGAPIEDTGRTEFVNVGNHASTSQTEAGVMLYQRARANVRQISRELDKLRERVTDEVERTTRYVGSWAGASDGEYVLPAGPVCYRKGCPKRTIRQSFRAWSEGCEGCGRGFER